MVMTGMRIIILSRDKEKRRVTLGLGTVEKRGWIRKSIPVRNCHTVPSTNYESWLRFRGKLNEGVC